MRTYAVDYEFGTQRQIALRMPACPFFAGELKATPEAVGGAQAKLRGAPRPRNPLEDPSLLARHIARLIGGHQRSVTTNTKQAGPNIVPFPSSQSGQKEVPPQLGARGGTESKATADSSSTTPPGVTPTRIQPPHTYPQTDLGNALFFIDRFGGQVRYDQNRRLWLVWRGHHWELDRLGQAAQSAQDAARLRTQAAVMLPSGAGKDEARIKAISCALQSEGRYRIESVLALAKDNSRISVDTAKDWDTEPWRCGVLNGVVDLRTGTLRPGRPEDKIIKQASVGFYPDAQCPRFERFLSEIFDGNRELVTYTRRALGYTLSGVVTEDCWFGCYGTGGNGKSVLFKILHHVFGDYAYVANFSLVERGRGESKRDFDIAYLQNTRLVMASETRDGGTWDEERLKRLTGRDPLHGEFKFGREFNFMPSHKLWFMFNHQPRARDHSLGFWRRVRLIPFMKQFQGEAADKNLDVTLAREREGVLAWLVRACLEWQREGLSVPDAVLSASRQYQQDEDPLHDFIQQYIRREDGEKFKLKAAFTLYVRWCRDEHVSSQLGRNRFGTLLETHGFKRFDPDGTAWYRGGKLIHTCTCMRQPCVCLG